MFSVSICLSFFFSFFVMLLSNFLMNKNDLNFHKLSSFECGFLSFFKLRSPFSLRFFLISLIFLIFDIEIIFIFPIFMTQTLYFYSFFSFIILFFFIFYGLIHEWYIGSLNWLHLMDNL